MVEIVKIVTALLNILTLVIAGNLFGKESIFFIISINSLSFILAIIFDKGLAIFNGNISLKKDIFFLKDHFLYKNNIFSSLIFFTIIIVLFFLELELKLIVILSLILSIPNLILLRWRLVKVRDGEFLRASSITELVPACFKFFLVPLIYFNVYIYIIFFTIISFIHVINLLKKDEIKNILQTKIVQTSKLSDKGSNPITIYSYGTLVSIKNYGMGSLLSFVDQFFASILFLITRLNQINIIIFSGIFSRVPAIIKNDPRILTNKILLIIFIVIIALMSLILVFQDQILLILNFIFYGNNDLTASISKFLFLVFIFPVFIGFINAVFQALGKINFALFVEFFYVVILLGLLIYFGILNYDI